MMRTRLTCALLLTGVAWLTLGSPPAPAVGDAPLPASAPRALWLESLDLTKMTAGWKSPQAGKSIEGRPLRLQGTEYAHGVGTHAASDYCIDLKGAALAFRATVGVDDESRGGSVVFIVYADNKKVAEVACKSGDGPVPLDVPLVGVKRLSLQVTDGGNGNGNDHADWADAALILDPVTTAMPVALDPPGEGSLAAPVAIAKAPAAPRLHGPLRVGAAAGRPFLYRIPATGDGPLTYAATGLPAGLALDQEIGLITGIAPREGTYPIILTVSGSQGSATGSLHLAVGSRGLALTPPMGWNSWAAWGREVDDKRVRAAADMLVQTGLAAWGYQYVVIDDGWAAGRDAQGEIRPDGRRFPDMAALAAYVHARGLKLGITASPGLTTCANNQGSGGHEMQDARTFARWGIDYLRYDWGACRNSDFRAPFQVMRAALDACERDMLYSVSEYGLAYAWDWAAEKEIGATSWRVATDIADTWARVLQLGCCEESRARRMGPGHWLDLDALMVGKVGWGKLRDTRLTPEEQRTQMTLWCMRGSPLFLGCDVGQLDEDALALLTNDEVLAVDQDPLAAPARRALRQGDAEVWARPLANGDLAVVLLNGGDTAADVRATWVALGLVGTHPVRDLWAREDWGPHTGAVVARVPGHGAVLLRIGPAVSRGATRKG